jgi:hypothetical protein
MSAKGTAGEGIALLLGVCAFLIAPHCFARGLDAIHAGAGWIVWGAWWSVLAWVSTRTDDTEGK